MGRWEEDVITDLKKMRITDLRVVKSMEKDKTFSFKVVVSSNDDASLEYVFNR